MGLKMKHLINCFEAAKQQKSKYVAVKIHMEGFEKPEIIINSIENFDKKLEYYKNAYDEVLRLKAVPTIKIIGFTFGNVFESIEKELIG